MCHSFSAAEKITSNIVEINQKIEDYFNIFNVEIFDKMNILKQKLDNINLLNPKEKIIQLKNKIETFKNKFQKFMEQEFEYNLNLKSVEKSYKIIILIIFYQEDIQLFIKMIK